MTKKYKEVVLKPFSEFGKDYAKGDIYRYVTITERDAEFNNSRKEDFGFEYIPVDEKMKKIEPIPAKVELFEDKVQLEKLPDEEVKAEQKTMATPQPKKGFPKKKQ